MRYLAQLREILVEHFDTEELRTLCFDLDVLYDSLPAEGHAGKARELVAYMNRHSRIRELEQAIRERCPNIPQFTSRIPHNLPPRSEFVGRKAEKVRIHKAFRSRSHLVSIDGIGGVGKTALALEVAYECLSASKGEGPADDIVTFDGFIWTTAKDRDLTLNDLLDVVARTLDYPGIIEQAVTEKRVSVCRLLQERRYLMIVDSFEAVTDDNVWSFLLDLPEPSKVLITTRGQILRSAWIVSLKNLTQFEALALIRSESQRLDLVAMEHAEERLLLPLYQATGGIPLAIKWVMGQIKQRGQSRDTVLMALREGRGDIFDNIFDRSWQLLSQDARRVLVVMPLFATSATRAAIEAISDVHNAALDQALEQLVEMSLLDVTGEFELASRRYSIHPLTRAYATLMQKSAETSQFVQKSFERMFERMLAYYQGLVTPPEEVQVGVPYWDGLMNYAGIYTLEQEWPNVNQLIRRTLREGRDAQALNLFLPIVHLLNAWGLWDERLELSREMCVVANRLGDSSEAWLWLDAITWILLRRHKFHQAAETLKKGRQVAQRFDLADALIQADAYEARLSLVNGDVSSASRKIESILTPEELNSVLKHSSLVHQIVIARMVNAVGTLKQSEKKFTQAKEWFERELDLRRSIGENVAPMLARLGHISILLDEIASAEMFLDQAVNDVSPKDVALIHYSRALIAQRKSQTQKAQHLCDIALDLYTRLGMESEIQECQKLLAELEEGQINET